MKVKQILIAVLVLSINAFGQSGKYSIGVVSTHFVNAASDNKISNVENPNSFGIVLGARLNDEVSLAFTTEYFDGKIKESNITEKNYRAHLSLYFKPVTIEKLSPYFSAGMVLAYRKTDNLANKSSTQLFGRFGFGVDYNLINRLFLNADMGFYSNGLNYSGISTSLGLRFLL